MRELKSGFKLKEETVQTNEGNNLETFKMAFDG